jgi:hypothetical protein
MDIPAYRAKIRKQHAELQAAYQTGFLHVVSLKNVTHSTTAGRVVQVSILDAAKLIVDATHRPATAEEIQGFMVATEAQGHLIAAQEARKIPSSFRN